MSLKFEPSMLDCVQAISVSCACHEEEEWKWCAPGSGLYCVGRERRVGVTIHNHFVPVADKVWQLLKLWAGYLLSRKYPRNMHLRMPRGLLFNV